MRRIILAVSVLIVALAAIGLRSTPAAAQDNRCFPETSRCISGRFRQFWEQSGGLPVFGFPLTAPFTENGRTVQYFERERFELHPENRAPYDVLLGRLGDDALRSSGVDWTTLPKFDPSHANQADCQYFAQTGHAACGLFLAYWRSHGLEFDGRPGVSANESLALFGYPLTEPLQFVTSDGQTLQVQWFERARFESHPNNPAPYNVLLGRLGAELHPTVDVAPAVQTVLNYYDAINQRAFDQAYILWSGSGAASGQTPAQFRQGYADTVRVDLLLGGPQVVDAGHVTVPLTILAVVNDPRVVNVGQRVQQFQGSYTVAQEAVGWRLASASIAETTGALPPSARSAPQTLIQSYYDAINQGNIASAYVLWEDLGGSSGQTFAQFEQGYANTAHVAVDIGQPREDAGAGSRFADVPVVIYATQIDGSQQTFCGVYSLRSVSLPPFDKLGWHIGHASVAPTANVAPGSPHAKRLLEGGCSS